MRSSTLSHAASSSWRYARYSRVRSSSPTPLASRVFMGKPPLVSWRAALVCRLAGPTEWARLVSVGAAMVAVLATCRLGALLYGGTTGLVAGLALATSLGFVLEARTLRPDMILTAAVAVALLWWQTAERCGARRARWLAGLYAALGVGRPAERVVPLVVAAPPV